ncbi:MAG: HAD-IIA family hydrolase [Anaerolineales bacterium]|nr:HAD-IIA family hydrolase [Anaerolineales bacterium]
MDSVHQARGLLIDMDGVLWRGRTFLPGVQNFFAALRSRNVPFLLVTNNATASPDSAVERLAGAGVAIEPHEVLTSALATAAYLQSVLPQGASVYAIGEEAVRSALQDAGFQLQDGHDSAQAVVVGFDREISWYKMTQAALAIQAGALFVGTNPDVSFPIEGGQAPGNGAFVLAIEAATSAKPVIVGKPEPLLFQQAVERLGLKPEQTLMLGDRLETDILGAQRAGIASALLLTGVTSIEQIDGSGIEPDFIFEDLNALTAALQAGLN